MSAETIKAALEAVTEDIKQNPIKANALFLVETQLEEGLRCSAKARDFPPLTVDEPKGFGGTDQGMNPAEVLLAALGTCQEIMYSAFASAMGIELDELKIECEGDIDLHGMMGMDDAVPPGFAEVRFEAHIKSKESPERIRELVEMAQTHGPLLDTITRPVRTIGNAYLNGELVNSFEPMQDAAE